MAGCALNARSVAEVGYASMAGCALNARSVAEVGYASMAGSALNARSVVEVRYANIAGSATIARSVEVVEYASMANGATDARSAKRKRRLQRPSLPSEQPLNESESQSEEAVALPPLTFNKVNHERCHVLFKFPRLWVVSRRET
jgi:hypothetical protein